MIVPTDWQRRGCHSSASGPYGHHLKLTAVIHIHTRQGGWSILPQYTTTMAQLARRDRNTDPSNKSRPTLPPEPRLPRLACILHTTRWHMLTCSHFDVPAAADMLTDFWPYYSPIMGLHCFSRSCVHCTLGTRCGMCTTDAPNGRRICDPAIMCNWTWC